MTAARRADRIAGRLALAAVLCLAALASCRREQATRPYQSMGAEAEALRAAFNADAGTVRLVILLAPT